MRPGWSRWSPRSRRVWCARGPQIQVHGSGNLIQTLLEHDLIDVFSLLIFPLLLGTGKRLFADGTIPTGLTAVDVTTTSRGVIAARYERAGDLTYGSFAVQEATEVRKQLAEEEGKALRSVIDNFVVVGTAPGRSRGPVASNSASDDASDYRPAGRVLSLGAPGLLGQHHSQRLSRHGIDHTMIGHSGGADVDSPTDVAGPRKRSTCDMRSVC
jgi:RibD C-terminal domain